MSNGKNFGPIIPSELRLSAKWDYAVENFVTRASLGVVIGGIASIVLFRGRTSRMAFATFGMGIGVGDAYRLSAFEFEKEKADK
mmetsp:Transcript_28365/g.62837  ORF Transcript_28365/g.62837 Transcript_28365/m.62837 type:complete len:84 (+) Transcript_28365:50-301(+)|eukprot:CAMPEP_0173199648 /NCGR_PEP_ID=MMETSP1141-20130122/17352_1 /TAXON_ID=483371 /ORGANISM="non described non described, Strain CCMP2298" /LENGTH=83 /DNA_ID=CAMNT_0014124561 /DNA_START=49 /DNA_END=300 /DNA_ORIENTATION=-